VLRGFSFQILMDLSASQVTSRLQQSKNVNSSYQDSC
jgi:hypothetical protein